MIDWQKMAARAAANGRTGRNGPSTGASASTDLAQRTSTVTYPYHWTGTRRHGNKRTSKGGSSTGGARGMWATVSCYDKTGRFEQ